MTIMAKKMILIVTSSAKSCDLLTVPKVPGRGLSLKRGIDIDCSYLK